MCFWALWVYIPSSNSPSQLVTWSNLQPPFLQKLQRMNILWANGSWWSIVGSFNQLLRPNWGKQNAAFFQAMQSWGKASEICTQEGPQGAARSALDLIIISMTEISCIQIFESVSHHFPYSNDFLIILPGYTFGTPRPFRNRTNPKSWRLTWAP